MTDRDRLAADLRDTGAFGWLPDRSPKGEFDEDCHGTGRLHSPVFGRGVK